MKHDQSPHSNTPTTLLCSLVLFTSLAACSPAAPPPASALTEAQVVISVAEQIGAEQHASFELEEARRQLALAEEAAGNDDTAATELFARQSAIAARMGIARAESAHAESTVNSQITWADPQLDIRTREADKARVELTAALGYSALTATDLQRRIRELVERSNLSVDD